MIMAVALLACLVMVGPARAGQIVYVRASGSLGGGDLWVMNDDGSDQRPLLTQAQAGATALDDPDLLPSGSSLAFTGETPAPDGSCDTNCIAVMTLVGGALHRITPAPINCSHSAAISCTETSDWSPTLTPDGRVLYLHSSAIVWFTCGLYYCGGDSAVGNQYSIQSDLGGDQPNRWPTPEGNLEPAAVGGYWELPAADPADPHLIAYPGLSDPAEPRYGVDPLVVDDDAAQNPFVVSDDDKAQSFVTWSPDGRYLLDIEGGENPGIWAYTAEPYTAGDWRGYYVMAAPTPTATGSGLGFGLAMTADGRVIFTANQAIYSLPANCGPLGGGAGVAAGEAASPNCELAQATPLTADGRAERPTWTALTTPLSYAPPEPSHAPPGPGPSPASASSTTPPGPADQGAAKISHATIGGVARRRARIAFSLVAGASSVKKIVDKLPPGLSFARSPGRLLRGIAVRGAGKKLKFATRVHGGALTLTLAKPAAAVEVTIVFPALAVGRTLAARVEDKRVKALTPVITAIGVDGRSTTLKPKLDLG